MWKHVKTKILTLLLVLSLFFIPVTASVDIRENIVFKTSGNNARFVMGTDLTFYRVRVNSSHLWLDQAYSTKHYTEYCIYIISPDDCKFTVDSWFATGNSTGQLTITSPLSTNINLGFHSPNLISASATGVVSETWYSANKTLLMVANSDVNPIIITASVTETLEENTAPENYDVEITDMEGCGDWVFSEESYYTFQAQYWDGNGWADLDTCKIAFTDGVSWVNASYDVSASEYTLESGSDVARLKSGTVTIQDANLLQVTFLIYFQNKILDAYDVDILMWCNDTYGAVDDWEIMVEDYFSIYNLGGHSTLTSSGDAGRIDGGDVFELYAYNDSWVDANMLFRNLQHIKLLPVIVTSLNLSYEARPTITYYFDYCTEDDDWIDGFELKLRMAAGQLSSDYRYRRTIVESYMGTQLIKNETIYTYWQTQHYEEPVYANQSLQVWIDIWFNKQNASSIIGGRINAYYYPMKNNANLWLRWLTGDTWGMDEEKRKQCMSFTTLLDSTSDVIHTQEIKMVKVGCKLEMGSSGMTVYSQLSDYDIFDITIGGDPFSGIQTPVFDETKVPVMPQGGFLGSVVSWFSGAITWLADNIMYGGLNLWGHFVGFMDTIAGWLGFPNAFTNLITWLGSIWTWMTISFGWLISLLTDTFNFLAAFMGKFVNTTSMTLSIFTDMINKFFFMLDTGYGYSVGMWEMLGMTYWTQLFFILYPLYLLYLWDDRGLDAVISHIKMVIDIFAFIGTLFIGVIQLTLNVIGRIIESIPIIEILVPLIPIAYMLTTKGMPLLAVV